MNFDEINIDTLNENEIIKMYSDIVDSGDTEDKLHILADCTVANGYWYCKSDRRLKENIKDNYSGLNEIIKLNVKNYIYINDDKRIPHVGVIAQELIDVFPNAVAKDKDGYLCIRTEDIFYAMVNSIKELSQKNIELENKLENTINALKKLELENLVKNH